MTNQLLLARGAVAAVILGAALGASAQTQAPATPLRLLVEGRWIEGETTRRIGPPAEELLEKIG